MKHKSTALILVGCLLIAAAGFLTGYNIAEDKNAGMASEAVISVLHQAANNQKAIWENTDEQVIPDYLLNPDMEMLTVTADDTDYIGILEIPAQGLKLGVASELTMPALKKSPCRYYGSIYDDNCIIAAHNYQSHFGQLPSVQIGDKITFTDVEGTVFEYKVSAIEIIPGTDSDTMKEEGDWDLSLFTCTLTRTERLTIRCKRIEQGGSAV